MDNEKTIVTIEDTDIEISVERAIEIMDEYASLYPSYYDI